MELKGEKEKNEKLQIVIIELNNIINQLKQKNNIDNKKYDEEIKAYIKKIEVMNNDIQKIILENNNLKDEIKKSSTQNNSNNPDNKMLKLYEKIEELNEKLKRYPFILEEKNVFYHFSICYNKLFNYL